MNKLDEHGLVPFPGYDQIGSGKQRSWLRATSEERDALLVLFQEWIDEADEVIKRNHYKDLGQEGIAYLYSQVAQFRANGKPPG